MEGRDHQAMQRKYQEMVADLDKIDAQLVRKAAELCTKACIGSTSLSNSEVVNACMLRCEASRPVLDQTVQQELTNLQGLMQLCALDCADKMAVAVPPGTKEGDPVMQQGALQNMECTAACASKSVVLMSSTLAKITAAAHEAAKKANK
ncbi:duf842 [Ectocarpus sp. CCAP 1310/34]|nr:duf842 [Ectocarpus sp. CCAP 1310/34]